MDLRPINPYYRRTKKRFQSRVKASTRSTTYSYPYEWIPPVTDRTQADVDHARKLLTVGWSNLTTEQREEYMAGLKGCINMTDLARIENNIQILIDVLELKNTSHVDNVPELPTGSYFAEMRDNIAAIRTAYFVHKDTPEVPDLPFNTWQDYNAIEQILGDVYEVVNSQFNYYAGTEIYAGDAVGRLL